MTCCSVCCRNSRQLQTELDTRSGRLGQEAGNQEEEMTLQVWGVSNCLWQRTLGGSPFALDLRRYPPMSVLCHLKSVNRVCSKKKERRCARSEGIRIFERHQPLGRSSCNYLGYEEVVTGTFVTLYGWPDLSETYNCPNVA